MDQTLGKSTYLSAEQHAALWNCVWHLYHEAMFQNIRLHSLRSIWNWGDFVAKLLTSLTAAGSAVAIWTLWQTDVWKVVWSAICGFAGIVGLVHATVKIPERIAEIDGELEHFTQLSLDLEKILRTYRSMTWPEIMAVRGLYNECWERHVNGKKKLKHDHIFNSPIGVFYLQVLYERNLQRHSDSLKEQLSNGQSLSPTTAAA